MVSRAKQIEPNPIRDLMRRVAALESEVRELRAVRRLESATIGAGGLQVKDGGTITVDDEASTPMIWLGQVPFGDGSTKPGMVAFRSTAEGGTVAMSLYDGIFAAWDRQGSIVLSTDEVSGQGIGRPWLPINFGPSDFTVWPGTTSGTFDRIWEVQISRQQPRIYVMLFATTDVSGTTGELRLACNGVQVGATQSISFGMGYREFGPASLPDGVFGDIMQLTVDARRTAGTGKVRAAVAAAWTQQS